MSVALRRVRQGIRSKNLQSKPGKLHTTIDPRLRRAAEAAIRGTLNEQCNLLSQMRPLEQNLRYGARYPHATLADRPAAARSRR